MTRRPASPRPRSPATRRVAATELMTELDLFRAAFQQAVASYQTRVEGDIVAIRDATRRLLEAAEVTPTHVADMRSMLTALRKLDARPLKGRRKDIRRMDEIIGDLVTLIDAW